MQIRYPILETKNACKEIWIIQLNENEMRKRGPKGPSLDTQT